MKDTGLIYAANHSAMGRRSWLSACIWHQKMRDSRGSEVSDGHLGKLESTHSSQTTLRQNGAFREDRQAVAVSNDRF